MVFPFGVHSANGKFSETEEPKHARREPTGSPRAVLVTMPFSTENCVLGLKMETALQGALHVANRIDGHEKPFFSAKVVSVTELPAVKRGIRCTQTQQTSKGPAPSGKQRVRTGQGRAGGRCLRNLAPHVLFLGRVSAPPGNLKGLDTLSISTELANTSPNSLCGVPEPVSGLRRLRK